MEQGFHRDLTASAISIVAELRKKREPFNGDLEGILHALIQLGKIELVGLVAFFL